MDTVDDTPAPEQEPAGKPPAGVRPSARRAPASSTGGPGDAIRGPAVRIVFMALFLPFMLVFALIEALGEASHRTRARRQRSDAAHPPRPPRPRVDGERSVAALVEKLRTFPFRPLPLNAQMAFYRTFGADGIGMLLGGRRSTSTLFFQYPRDFALRLFRGHGDVRLSGVQAMHDHPAPALIICHGLLTTKNFDYIRRMAVRAHRRWGFHVIAIDLRGWGQSDWTCDGPACGGYMEGFDVARIAEDLRHDPLVTSVGVFGHSLGGATVLNAAREASLANEPMIDGGVMAVSAPSDMRMAIAHISKRPPVRDPFFPLWCLFRAGLRSRARQEGWEDQVRSWQDAVKYVSLPHYELTEEKLYESGSAINWAADLKVPTLALHAADDFVVPVAHAEKLREAAADNPNVAVWVTERGSHCSFDSVDPRWFHSIVRRWFEHWATWPDEQDEPARD